jgi:mannose-1-phosphate guanylyltransferase
MFLGTAQRKPVDCHPMTEHFWALVLAGGDGIRLQSLTQLIAGARIPKQYCRILGGRTLLETTLWRIAPLVATERTLAIINRDHLAIARSQLRSLDTRNILVQPRNLDTGPGVLVSMIELARRDPDATVAIFPSDHYVRESGAFRGTIERMYRVVAALPEKIALLGARPEHPDSGYGYITPGRPVGPDLDTFAVLAFHEKPTAGVAAHMVRRGALWNSLVMVAHVGRLLELLRALRAADVALLEDTPLDGTALNTAYDHLQAWNFSHEFLSRVPEHLIVTRADDLGWSDWGTPRAIERSFAAMGVVPPWMGRVDAPSHAGSKKTRRRTAAGASVARAIHALTDPPGRRPRWSAPQHRSEDRRRKAR